MLLVGYQLWRLSRNLKAGVFGSRLAARLVLLFALVAVLPGALVYAVSVQFLGKSIESWFDVRVDRALEGGLNLGRNALDYLLKETANKAGQIAVTLGEAAPGSLSTRLNRAAEQAGVFEATVFSSTGNVLAVAGIGGSTAPPETPPAQALRRARLQQTFTAIEQRGDGGLVLRVVAPVNSDDRLEPLRVLQLIEPVPKALGAGGREGAGGRPRLPGDLVLAAVAEAPLRGDADADAAARADLARSGSRSCCRNASPHRWVSSRRARARSRRATSRGGSR